jgi:hypothetical protein
VKRIQSGPRRDADAIRAAVLQFVKSCGKPSLLEPGEDFFELTGDSYSLDLRAGRLTMAAWDERRNVVRRVIDAREPRGDRMELVVERFGGKRGSIWLVDRASAKADWIVRRGSRLVFQARFEQFLARQYPQWRIAEITSEPDFQRTLSPVFPRAVLQRGNATLTAIGSPPEDTSGAVVSFGLIWHDYVKRREPNLHVQGQVLYVPLGGEQTACRRVRFLNRDRFDTCVFGYSEEAEGPLDTADYGNLDTRVEPLAASAASDPLEWLTGVERVPVQGGLSYRVRGLEFARSREDRCWFGLSRKTEFNDRHAGEVRQIVEELIRRRSPVHGEPRDPIYSQAAESWLESKVRAAIPEIDASLRPEPVYGQVPAWEGGDRGVIDLLAVDWSGRLAVIELKASEDLHLPLQALDYWMRVGWHLERGDFEANGYFRGLALRREPPRIFLVSPALEVHPSNECVLRYIDRAIEVVHVGVASDWRWRLRVMFRQSRAQAA